MATWRDLIGRLMPVRKMQNIPPPKCIVGVEAKALFCKRTYSDPSASPCTHTHTHTHFLVEQHTNTVDAIKGTHMQTFRNKFMHFLFTHTHTHSSFSTTAAQYCRAVIVLCIKSQWWTATHTLAALQHCTQISFNWKMSVLIILCSLSSSLPPSSSSNCRTRSDSHSATLSPELTPSPSSSPNPSLCHTHLNREHSHAVLLGANLEGIE